MTQRRNGGWRIGHLFSRPTPVPETFREWVEQRVQIATEQAHAAQAATVKAALHALRESNEQRIQIATHQAMSHADQSIGGMTLALKGVAKALITFKRQVELSSYVKHEDLTSTIAAFDTELSSLHIMLNTKLEDRNNVSTSVTSLIDQPGSVARELESGLSDHILPLRFLENRFEVIRSELMHELHTSIVRGTDDDRTRDAEIAAKIINPEKVNSMRSSGLRLNIGCGHAQLADYINIDRRHVQGVDVISEATELPFKAGEIAEIASTHLIERITQHTLDRVLLPHWKSLLRSGGQLTTVASDGAAMMSAVNSGTMSFNDFKVILFGGQDYDSDPYHNLITSEFYRKSLHQAGFVDIEDVYSGKRNGGHFDFKITARKP